MRNNFSTGQGLTVVEIIDLNLNYICLLTFLYLFYFFNHYKRRVFDIIFINNVEMNFNSKIGEE